MKDDPSFFSSLVFLRKDEDSDTYTAKRSYIIFDAVSLDDAKAVAADIGSTMNMGGFHLCGVEDVLQIFEPIDDGSEIAWYETDCEERIYGRLLQKIELQ